MATADAVDLFIRVAGEVSMIDESKYVMNVELLERLKRKAMMRNRDKSASGMGNDGHGLTKREAAAIAAMQGLWAHEESMNALALKYDGNAPMVYQSVAKAAVFQADAVFDELEKTDE